MRELRKALFVVVGGYGFLTTAYALAIRAYFPEAPFFPAPLLAIFALMLLGALKPLALPTPWMRALRRHRRDPRPRDGEFSAVEGRLVALGEPLRSPLGGEPCVFYETEIYKIERLSEGGLKRYYDWKAIASAPCAVESPLGRVQLLGLFNTQHVPCEEREGSAVRENARAWTESAVFEPKPKLRDAIGWARDLLDDDSASSYRGYREDDAVLDGDHLFEETVLRPGETVTAIGRYDAARGALAPRGGLPTELLRGDARSARRTIGARQGVAVAFAVALFAFSHGVAAVFALAAEG